MSGNDSIYPINAVISMTNLSARQIRYYESHGLIKPARSKGNQRLYTPSDIENLLLIKSLLEKGLNIEGIKSVMTGAKTIDAPINTPTTTTSTPNQTVFSPQRPTGPKLVSLYPVNNQEALTNWLQQKRK